jgi:hypothetical protein
MPCKRLPRIIKKLHNKRQKEPEEISGCETKTGQQAAQLHESYMMMMMMRTMDDRN